MALFKVTSPKKVRAEQLYEAKREHLEHAASAEHHQALADMYGARAARLQADIDAEEAAAPAKKLT